MDLIINNILIPIENDGLTQYEKIVTQQLGAIDGEIKISKLLSKTLKIDNPDQFYYKVSLVVSVDGSYHNKHKFPLYTIREVEKKKRYQPLTKPIIIGFGPAGMFAALELLDNGIQPIVFERGKVIEERTKDVMNFIKKNVLNTESNVQFGEGGAGSFSDGKLFSRRNNNSSYINKVLKTFVKFGAPKDIEYISKPHLGTDVLRKIVKNIRQHILENGGEIHFCAKMTDIVFSKGIAKGVIINGEKEYLSNATFLAIGHSAREAYKMLHNNEISLQSKSISVGLRIEHPVGLINLMRYGKKYQNNIKIGAATYSLNHTDKKTKRGVYTFCMCPGGEIINASSSNNLMVVNGMSYSNRSSPYSNAALVVNCHTSDFKSDHPLAGIDFQRDIEKKTFEQGGCNWQAPAQNLTDFLKGTRSSYLNDSSFKMGVISSEMREIVPEFVASELVVAFSKWKKSVPLFISEKSLLIGTETRTSSPVRVVRNDNYESENMKNLYPIGEGSGYTGGITSSAADAIRAVEKYINKLV